MLSTCNNTKEHVDDNAGSVDDAQLVMDSAKKDG